MILATLLLALAQWTPEAVEQPVTPGGYHWVRAAIDDAGTRWYVGSKGGETYVAKEGGLFQKANQTTHLQQDECEVCLSPDGKTLAVLWSDRSGVYSSYMMSMFRLYDAATMQPLGNEIPFALQTSKGGTAFLPRAAPIVAGGWALTATASFGEDQMWRVLLPNGSMGPEQLCTLGASGVQDHGMIAEAQPGTVYVAYCDAGNARDIVVEPFAWRTGAKLGPPRTMHAQTANAQEWPWIAAAPDGTGLVVWEDYSQGNPHAIVARWLAPGGIPTGPEIQLGKGRDPHVALDAGLGVAVWHDQAGGLERVAWIEPDGSFALDAANALPLGPIPAQSQVARRNPSVVIRGDRLTFTWNAFDAATGSERGFARHYTRGAR